jgi:hypothetical protein
MTASTSKLRLDRSRTFSQIRGQRHEGDPHQRAHFQQDGIHFDSHGLHIDELITDEKTREIVDRRLKRQMKNASKKEDAGVVEEGDPVDVSTGSSTSDEVNLEAWLRGEEKYEWFKITTIVRDRFKVNITKQVDMVEFLVNEQKIIPIDEIDPKLADLLKPQS